MMFYVVCHRVMVVEATFLVHAVMQGTVSRFEHQAHALVYPVFSPRADRIQIGQCAFDLLQDGDRIRRRQQR